MTLATTYKTAQPAYIADDTDKLLTAFINNIDARARTKQTYKQGARLFVNWLIENGKNPRVKADAIAYAEYVRAAYKPTTAATYITSMRAFYKFLDERGLCPDLGQGIKGPKRDEGFNRAALTPAQARDLLDSIDRSTPAGIRDYALIHLFIHAGLRAIEATRLNVEDLRIELDRDGRERHVIHVHGKGRDDKKPFIPLSSSAYAVLNDYLVSRGPLSEGSPMFASYSNRNSNGRLTTRAVSGIVKSRMAGAGLVSPLLCCHSLRHTAATFSILGGARLEETQQFLRHRDPSITLTYVHALDRAANPSADAIDRILNGQGPAEH